MQGKIRRVVTGHDADGNAIVLEGEIVMVLDKEEVQLKAGDVVIQRGTNHAWANRSGKPAKMLYVLIDGEFDPALKDHFSATKPSR